MEKRRKISPDNAIAENGISLALFKVIFSEGLISPDDTCSYGTGLHKLVSDMTKEYQCSLVQLLSSKYRTDPHPILKLTYSEAVTERANRFVSYARTMKVHDIVDILEYHCLNENSNPSFWFDLFVCNQHLVTSPGAETAAYWSSMFKENIKKINYTLVLLSPWRQPTYIDRTWCIWEFYCSVEQGVNISVHFSQEDLAQLNCNMEVSTEDIASAAAIGHSISNTSSLSDIQELNKLILGISIERSQVFKDEDAKRLILSQIPDKLKFNSEISDHFRRYFFSNLTSKHFSMHGCKIEIFKRLKDLSGGSETLRISDVDKRWVAPITAGELESMSVADVMRRDHMQTPHPTLRLTYDECFDMSPTTAVSFAYKSNFGAFCQVLVDDAIINRYTGSYSVDFGNLIYGEIYPIDSFLRDIKVRNGLMKRTLLVLWPIVESKPIIFQRRWPLLEALIAYKAGATLDVTMATRDKEFAIEAIRSGNEQEIRKHFEIDFFGTECAEESDKINIQRIIEYMGLGGEESCGEDNINNHFKELSTHLYSKFKAKVMIGAPDL